MSDAERLLEELGSCDVEVWIDGGDLRYRAPAGAMTAELKARLTEHKGALISSLGARERGRRRGATTPRSRPVSPAAPADEPFEQTELQQAYVLGQEAFGELGDLPAQIELEFDLPSLDLDRADQVANRLIERHDALRVRMLAGGRQRVLRETPRFRIERIDGSGCPEEEATALRARIRTRLSSEAPDPFTGPPLAACALRTGSATTLFVRASLLVLDGTSLRILVDEALRLYDDPAAPLSALQLSYRGYVEGLARARDSASYRSSLAYWRGRLARLPGAPELPLVATTSSRRDRFVRRTKRLSPEAWRTFKAHAQRAGVTASAALATAYASVLAAWSRRPTFLLNVMHLNRVPLHPDAGRVAGNFASTVLTEVAIDLRATFAGRARSLQGQLLTDLSHAQVSGMVVARELNLAEHAGPRARAPVVFASALDPSGARRTGWLDALARGSLSTPHVWLDHQAIEDGGAIVLNWDAVEELFPAGLIDDAHAAHGALVDRLAASAEAWRETPMLVPAAHRTLAGEANSTARELPLATLPELVDASCARAPHAVAVVAGEVRLTYRELDARAGAVAAWLRRRGARRGGLVAVVMEKGWEQVVGVLAVVRAGAAYLPVDPALPASRIQFLLSQCEPALALTQERVGAAIAWPDGFARLSVDRPPAEPGSTPPDRDGASGGPDLDDLAYVLFTSGSTGTPKGVMISHRGAVNTILDVNQRFAVTAGDRTLALSSLSFDLSVHDVFGLLAAGGAVIIPPATTSPDPGAWLELARRERVTIWNSVPALAQLVAEHLDGAGESAGFPLRLVLLSGDWIPVRLPARLRALAPDACVMSLGGATEASIWSILHPTGGVSPDAPSIPYGKAMANQTVHVLDDALEPRPVWVPGELYIGGVGVALGYFRDPERTAERFLVHPRTGERLYRTGDIGRWLPDGTIEFLGREDAQVKVQGFRIELGEIERALEQTPGVRAAVVAAVGERHGPKSLVAQVVPDDPAAPPDPASLRLALADRLPAHMVPPRIVLGDRLPLGANGKLDRGALARVAAAARPELVPPSGDVEVALAGLWREVLGAPQVGAHDDFFALGGHSLAAVRLTAMVQARFGRGLALGSLLAHPTLAAQARLLRDSSADPGGARDADRPSGPVVCLAPGDDPPLFLVHPVGGNVVCYRELARLLRSCGAVHGIHSDDPPLDPGAPAPASLSGLAARYVEAVRQVQARGPYRLGGWSLGGLVAVEMARILCALDEPIELVFTIDSRLPHPPGPPPDRAQLVARFVGDLGGRAAAPPDALVEELRAAGDAACIGRAHEWASQAGIIPAELCAPAFERMVRVFERNARALFAYRPAAIDVPTLALCATGAFAGHADARDLPAGRARVHAIAADHYTIMRRPILDRVAGLIRDALAGMADS